MLDDDRFPPGVPCRVDLVHDDPRGATRFYGRLFGWSFDDDGIGRLGGAAVAGVVEEHHGARWRTSVRVADVEDAVVRAVAAGARVVREPHALGAAGRAAVLADPLGAELGVWEPGTFGGAERVNAAATWNWSDLYVADHDAARAFYGTLFGWEATAVDFGDGGTTEMWRLPGYGDHLARRDPDLRRRHAQPGVPEGFSDAIGWLVAPDDAGAPPQWSVTFAVDDVDAVAARAEQLGGVVTVPPFDAGPSRGAALTDPAGAAFTIGSYAGSAG